MTKTRQWTIFTAIAVLIVVVAGWMLAIKPQRSHAADLRTQASDEQSQVATLQSQIAALQQQQKNLPAEQRKLQKFSTQVPDAPSEPTLLRQLSDAASGADVDLLTVTPGAAAAFTGTSSTGATTLQGAPTTGATGLTELPLTLGIAGTYPNLEMFFQLLEKLPRAMQVTGFSVCPVSSGDSSSATSTSGGGAGCSAPALPSGKTVADGTLGGTLNTRVFYAGTAAPTSAVTGTTGTTTTTGTSPTTSTTTPVPTTSATPATSK
jgi:Tfp pilus assembly protein PilO